jgi:hypothetical protein
MGFSGNAVANDDERDVRYVDETLNKNPPKDRRSIPIAVS